jgi:hypothetical protein
MGGGYPRNLRKARENLEAHKFINHKQIQINYFVGNHEHSHEVIDLDLFVIFRIITCASFFRGGEYSEGGYIAVGSFLFLKKQIKDIIIFPGIFGDYPGAIFLYPPSPIGTKAVGTKWFLNGTAVVK